MLIFLPNLAIIFKNEEKILTQFNLFQVAEPAQRGLDSGLDLVIRVIEETRANITRRGAPCFPSPLTGCYERLLTTVCEDS